MHLSPTTAEGLRLGIPKLTISGRMLLLRSAKETRGSKQAIMPKLRQTLYASTAVVTGWRPCQDAPAVRAAVILGAGKQQHWQ
jgi:hypothetical protein